MFHDRKYYNKIHERALRITHKDSTSNFEGLLIKSNSVSVHQRTLQLLLIEIYKTINNFNPFLWQKYLLPMLCRIIFVAALILFYPKLGQTGTDPELNIGGGHNPDLNFGGAISVFSCKKFLNTIVCHRKHCRLGVTASRAPWICP